MPQLHASFHDQFVEDYLNSLESKVIAKERLLPCLAKNGWLLPLHLLVTHVHSILTGSHFLVKFRLEKPFSPNCHLLVDLHLNVIGMTASSLNLLGLYSQKTPFSILSLLPSFPLHLP
jgi:hypothetical protein